MAFFNKFQQLFSSRISNENGLLVKRRERFPIKVEKNGVTVPVSRVRSGSGYESYVISYRENGCRKKKGFPTVGQDPERAAKKAEHGVLQLHHAHLPPPLLDGTSPVGRPPRALRTCRGSAVCGRCSRKE